MDSGIPFSFHNQEGKIIFFTCNQVNWGTEQAE